MARQAEQNEIDAAKKREEKNNKNLLNRVEIQQFLQNFYDHVATEIDAGKAIIQPVRIPNHLDTNWDITALWNQSYHPAYDIWQEFVVKFEKEGLVLKLLDVNCDIQKFHFEYEKAMNTLCDFPTRRHDQYGYHVVKVSLIS